jgi:2,3-bisphosphoglycerate-independent phosphoglycerate mutase
VLDSVLTGLIEAWDDSSGLILVTSDHGNLEDLSTRRHTDARVPGLLIGSADARHKIAAKFDNLGDVAPAIWSTVMGDGPGQAGKV